MPILSSCEVQQDSILQTGVCASQSSRTPMLDCLYSTRHRAQPDFAVVNCSDIVMSVIYSPVLIRSLIFCSNELRRCSVECIFFRYPNLERR